MTPAIELLRSAGVEHSVLTYDSAGADFGREAVVELGLTMSEVFKTLVVDADGRFAVAVLPVGATLSLKAMAVALSAKRVVMADVGRAERATGYVAGGISPIAQRRELPTVVDASIESLAVVHISGGRRGVEIALAPHDLIAVVAATLAPIAIS
ncbi:MAG: aminoacyl-tRNA deacylase [Actinomycetota bacterium]